MPTQLIDSKPLQIVLNKEYNLNELQNVKKWIQIKQGTQLNEYSVDNQLHIICQGHQIYHSHQQNKITRFKFNQIKDKCTFKLRFKLQETLIQDQALKDLIKKQKNHQQSNNLKHYIYKLYLIHLIHAQKCITSDLNFIFTRNTNFMKQNNQLLCKLIHNRYLQIKIPETPKIYRKYIFQYLGYNFIHHGFQLITAQQSQRSKIQLRKRFDNIVQQAKRQYKISDSKNQIQNLSEINEKIHSSKQQNTYQGKCHLSKKQMIKLKKQNKIKLNEQSEEEESLYEPYMTKKKKYERKDKQNSERQKI